MYSEKTYEDTISYLNNLDAFGWQPGLQRIERLMHLLGNPEKSYPTIHVGGTNGKGSVTVGLATVLKDCGYRVGQFISPEMFDVRDRIAVNGEWIKKDIMVRLVHKIKFCIQSMLADGYEHPTNFELWTALAFLYFKEVEVDIAVIEVGLGGAIDSTNVILPLFSILTNVSMDHKEYLGDTVLEIAEVKSGIIKPHTPVIVGVQDESILKVIEGRAASLKSPTYRLNKEFFVRSKGFYDDMSHFTVSNQWLKEELFSFSLLGYHQVRNGSLIIEGIMLLQEMGFKCDLEVVKESMKKVYWPGRLELMHYQGKRVLLDAAHNVDGARNLALSLKDIYSYRRLIFIVGILGDKQRQEMINYLGPLGDGFVVTKPNSPRANEFAQVGVFLQRYSDNVCVEESIEKALYLGLEQVEEEDLLCVTGSIYMIREMRRILSENN